MEPKLQLPDLEAAGPFAEELYRILVEEMSEGALTLSREGTILYCNPRFAEMLGLQPEQVLGKPFLDFVLPADRERLRDLLSRASSTSARTEAALVSARGKRVFTHISMRAWSPDGAQYLALVATDISERKRAEKRVVYQAHLLANVHDAVVATDPQHRITYWNHAAEETYGWQADETLGRDCPEVLQVELSAGELAEFFKALDETGHVQRQVVQHRKDAARLYIAVNAVTLRAKDGQIIGYVMVNQDITERLNAVGAMLESEERFQGLFNQTPIPTLVYRKAGEDFVLVRSNQAASEYSQGTVAKSLGQTVSRFFPDRPDIRQCFSACYDEKKTVHLSTPYRPSTRDEDRFLNWKFTYVAPDMVMVLVEDVTEHKRAEEALQEHARLLELTRDGMFVRDMQGRITFWNSGAVEMYGWSKQEALGRTSRELLQTQFPGPIEEIEAKVILEGRWEGEVVHTTRDGSTLIVSSRWALERDPNGRPLAILEINTDITRGKEAEEALRASEQRFRLAVDNFPGVLIIYDAERRIQFINTPGLVLNGVPERQLLGRTDEEIFPPQVTAPYLPLLQRASETGTVQSAEINVTLAAGTFAEKVTYVPLLDEYGEIQQILGIAEDITERKLAEEEIRRLNLELEQRVVERTAELESANRALVNEMVEHARADEALRQSEARFRLLAENAQDLIYRLHLVPQFHVEYMSPSATRILGYTPEEFYADCELVLGLIHPDDRPALEAITRGEILSDQPRALRWTRQDGAQIWLEHRNVPVYDDEGRPVAIEGIARDITERRQAEEALQQANASLTDWARELEQRNREISLLNEMGDLLQSCLTVEEAFRVIVGSARQLFPDDVGALYMLNESRTLLETVATWNDEPAGRLEHVLVPDNCWALRRGRMHVVEDIEAGLVCEHVSHQRADTRPSSYICLPMVAQGETLGVLHIQASGKGSFAESKQRLAVSIAEHVALAISSLRLRETLRSQAIRDSLTGLFNRRYMEESLERELRRAARKESTVGIIMLDLDHFKDFNDRYGHNTGDMMLRAFGQFLQSHVREGDIACRFGGEEFTLILPETTPDEAHARALEICQGFREVNVEHEGQDYGHLSVSLGIAHFPDHGTTAEELLRAADSALYQAKANGRDQVIIAPDSPEE